MAKIEWKTAEEIEQEESQPSKIERLETALMELAILTMNGGNGGE